MKKIGLIINPVAGLGGSVGLKGSDGNDIVKQALKLGAVPHSETRAAIALEAVRPLSEKIEFVTCPGRMGENVIKKAGFHMSVLNKEEESPDPDREPESLEESLGRTKASDTIEYARKMVECGCELILFAGGDGTARNIAEAVGTGIIVIGIPAGVKIHSAVYATNPRNAGLLLADYVNEKIRQYVDGEVMDIDEDAFRSGRVSAKLYGYMRIPLSRVQMQGCKISNAGDANAVEGVAQTIVKDMEPDVLYIVGPGSSTVPIMEILGLPATLLGVDLVKGGKLIAGDVTQKRILEELGNTSKAKIIVTPIGGQGNLFGRGNQQMGPEVLHRVGKANIIIAATRAKVESFYGGCMTVDTGDEEVNKEISGFYRVTIAYKQETVCRVGY